MVSGSAEYKSKVKRWQVRVFLRLSGEHLFHVSPLTRGGVLAIFGSPRLVDLCLQLNMVGCGCGCVRALVQARAKFPFL